jgi:hypothetical protein
MRQIKMITLEKVHSLRQRYIFLFDEISFKYPFKINMEAQT